MLDNLSWTLERVRAEPAVLPEGCLGDEGGGGKGRKLTFAGVEGPKRCRMAVNRRGKAIEGTDRL